MTPALSHKHTFLHLLVILSIFVTAQSKSKSKSKHLDVEYYKESCPEAEEIIKATLHEATLHDHRVPPRVLRMFFHDCFVRGCDGSVLIDSTKHNEAEKDARINMSLRAFYVYDRMKSKLEEACPNTVSCADIIAITARDAVVMSGGPYWEVEKGRKDGTISSADETDQLPKSSYSATQLINAFKKKGLNIKNVVALSGSHTIGNSHCSSFQARLTGYSDDTEFDPTLDFGFAQKLKASCPDKHFRVVNSGYRLDTTDEHFDTEYFERLTVKMGVLHSDQTLFEDPRTKPYVLSYLHEKLFFADYVESMLKLGRLGDHSQGEIRKNCRKVNSDDEGHSHSHAHTRNHGHTQKSQNHGKHGKHGGQK